MDFFQNLRRIVDVCSFFPKISHNFKINFFSFSRLSTIKKSLFQSYAKFLTACREFFNKSKTNIFWNFLDFFQNLRRIVDVWSFFPKISHNYKINFFCFSRLKTIQKSLFQSYAKFLTTCRELYNQRRTNTSWNFLYFLQNLRRIVDVWSFFPKISHNFKINFFRFSRLKTIKKSLF